MKLTVYHDGQFWVGVVEEYEQGKVRAGRVIFGSEPKDQEILAFVLNDLDAVTGRLSQHAEAAIARERKVNPKRLARLAAREMRMRGVSTYAQEALKLEHEKRKKEKQVMTRQQREERQEHKRELKRLKAKAKHRGR